MKKLAWAVGLVLGGFVLLLVVGALMPPETSEERQLRAQKCADAVMSSLKAPVRGYADKVAYDKQVAEACRGFDVPK